MERKCLRHEEEIAPDQCEACKRKDAPYTVTCTVCDEWEYCLECAYACECGVGPVHYLCPVDDTDPHFCQSECCPKRLCMNAAIPGYEYGGDIPVWCKDHRPPVSKQMKELVLESLSFEELEEAAAQKRSKMKRRSGSFKSTFKAIMRRRMEEDAEFIEYQQVVIREYEELILSKVPVQHADLMHCVTCNLPVNEATIEEFDSIMFECDECGLLPWCGRTACKEPELDSYEAGPEWEERMLCPTCANEIYKE